MIKRTFWWPDLTKCVTAYIQGCADCQQNKPHNHPRRTPQFRIPTSTDTHPFQTIGLDLITQLGADAILTIVDHGCSRAAIFLPCKTTITGEGIARLYMDHGPCLPMVWLTKQNHLRPGPLVYFPLCGRTDLNAGNSTKHLDGLSPSNRRIDGEKESVGGRVSLTSDFSATGRLGGLAGRCHRSAQPSLQCNHQNCPNRSPDGLLSMP